MSNSWVDDVEEDDESTDTEHESETESEEEPEVSDDEQEEASVEIENVADGSKGADTRTVASEPEPDVSPTTDGEVAENESSAESDDPDMSDESDGSDGSEESDDSDDSDMSGNADMPVPRGAMTVQEAAETERRWKMMVWGQPGLFKTHLGFTAPEPVAMVDLEGKSDDIASKFSDKTIYIWQPKDYEETIDALDDAIDWLRQVYDQTGKKGTIVVDSMTIAWDWAKYSYVEEAYPMDDVTNKLSDEYQNLNLDDWKWIKHKHNKQFRQKVVDSGFHFVWTAGETQQVDVDAGGSVIKPEGEKNNDHKADTIIRARKNSKGVKVGDMTKSNFTDRLFRGLEHPTFDKVTEVVKKIEEAEANPGEKTVSELEEDTGVEVIRHDPMYHQEDNNGDSDK